MFLDLLVGRKRSFIPFQALGVKLSGRPWFMTYLVTMILTVVSENEGQDSASCWPVPDEAACTLC